MFPVLSYVPCQMVAGKRAHNESHGEEGVDLDRYRSSVEELSDLICQLVSGYERRRGRGCGARM